MKRHLQKLPLGLTMAAVAAFMIYGFWPKAIEVDVATASRGTLTVTVHEDGKTRIREKYIVSAPVAGKLLRPELDEGDQVKKGETVQDEVV